MYIRPKVCTFSRLLMLKSTKYRERRSGIVFASFRQPVASPESRSCAAASLPTQDNVQGPPPFPIQSRRPLPSGDVASSFLAHRPALGGPGSHVWGRLSRARTLRIILSASSPLGRTSASAGAKSAYFRHKVPPWERIALFGGEGPRRSRR